MPFGPASRLGVSRFEETPPVEWFPGGSQEDADIIIKAVYRQVLGNAYVMESERLEVPESQFKTGFYSVREFVRAVAKSELYRSRFFTDCPRYRATELNFRHLLGRAPQGYDEMKMHSHILDTEGYDADIDSYIDSDEYQNYFGENIVPYIRGYKSDACQNMVQFTHTFELVRGSSSSSLKGDISGKKPKLNALVINATPTPVVSPASDGAVFQAPDNAPITRQGSGAGSNGKIYRIEVTNLSTRRYNTISKFRRANRVYMVPYEQLSQEYQRIQKSGGTIASITPV